MDSRGVARLRAPSGRLIGLTLRRWSPAAAHAVALVGDPRPLIALLRQHYVPGIAVITTPLGHLRTIAANLARGRYHVQAARTVAGTIPMQVFVTRRS